MKHIFFLTFTAGLFITLSFTEALYAQETGRALNAKTRQIIADFEKEVGKELKKDTTGSFSAVVFKGDEIVWSGAFGKANNQQGIAADTSTIYRIGSISKSITSYVMMMLVQNGTIHLDDKVANYLPEITQLKQDGKDGGGDITFRQLASHTSGLPREPELPHASSGPVEKWENKILSAIPTTTLHTPIGTTFLYSNIGYGILGLALSRAAHKPFIDMVEEMVFRPHGMTSSFYIIPGEYRPRIAAGYHNDDASHTYSTTEPERELAGRGYRVPNGGVFATADDLARFLMGLVSDSDPLLKQYRATMMTVQTKENADRGYGFGLLINNSKGNKMVGHDGVVSGFNAYMVFEATSRTGVVLFRNCDNTVPIIEKLADGLLAKLLKAD